MGCLEKGFCFHGVTSPSTVPSIVDVPVDGPTIDERPTALGRSTACPKPHVVVTGFLENT